MVALSGVCPSSLVSIIVAGTGRAIYIRVVVACLIGGCVGRVGSKGGVSACLIGGCVDREGLDDGLRWRIDGVYQESKCIEQIFVLRRMYWEGVCIWQGCIYCKGVYIAKVCILQGCVYCTDVLTYQPDKHRHHRNRWSPTVHT